MGASTRSRRQTCSKLTDLILNSDPTFSPFRQAPSRTVTATYDTQATSNRPGNEFLSSMSGDTDLNLTLGQPLGASVIPPSTGSPSSTGNAAWDAYANFNFPTSADVFSELRSRLSPSRRSRTDYTPENSGRLAGDRIRFVVVPQRRR